MEKRTVWLKTFATVFPTLDVEALTFENPGIAIDWGEASQRKGCHRAVARLLDLMPCNNT